MSVFVWIETFAGQANASSWEALGAGRRLADDLGIGLTALVFGENATEIGAAAGQYGAARAVTAEDDTLAAYRLEPYAALLTHLVREHRPAVVMAAASARGRELLASSAADLDVGLISETLDLRVEDGKIIGTRPVYGGKALMEMTSHTATTFVTIRARAFQALPRQTALSADVSEVSAVLDSGDISVQIEGFASEIGKVNLSEAAIVVSGGRGMANNPLEAPGLTGDEASVWKAKQGFKNTLQPLADVLGAAIGASRAAVDAGYIPYEHQVGQTGKVVNPDLYIACGISGAIQHQAGMRGSKIIVAINKDAAAPIFKLARYGIVGDLYEVAPALAKALRERLNQRD